MSQGDEMALDLRSSQAARLANWKAAWKAAGSTATGEDRAARRNAGLNEQHASDAFLAMLTFALGSDEMNFDEADIAALARHCQALTNPTERPDSGHVRLVYFSTRPSELQIFFGCLAFTLLLCAKHSENTEVVWIRFPLGLLGDAKAVRLRQFAAALESASIPRPALALEGEDPNGKTIWVSGERPECWSPGLSGFRLHYGLPVMFVPSRSVDTISPNRAPW